MVNAVNRKMKVLVTGSAGFIGSSLCKRLLEERPYEVYGIDDFNDYYDVELKRTRVEVMTPNMSHREIDLSNVDAVSDFFSRVKPDVVIHLAAQAGVRHSFEQPMKYSKSNLTGQVSILEAARKVGGVKRFIYASSSSVYSGVKKIPFHENTPLGTPKSLYAATKIADEVITDTYSSLFEIDAIGLRFFTVYGPWGRPDMAYWSFAQSILKGKEIKLFNYGDVKRDFTFIDDITKAILSMVDESLGAKNLSPTHRIYNIGNNKPEYVQSMISILESLLGVEAKVALAPLPPGDMVETYANVDKLQSDYGFAPSTPLEEGLALFVDWLKYWNARIRC